MTGPACGNNPNHQLTDGDRQAVDSFRAYLTTLASLRTAQHRLGQIRDAARLHRQQLVGTSELYAVIEADDAPPADQTALRDRIAAAMREHGMVHLGDQVPADEYECCADAVLAVLPATTDQTADEADVDTVANRAAQVIGSMGAEIRELRGQRDRNRTAWHSARRRASVLSAEITRRAPLLGEYTAQIEGLRVMYNASEARVNDLIEERDQLLEARADRAAVLREAAQRLYTALFPAVYADMGQKAAEGVNRAASELRRMADETPAAETHPPHRPVALATPCTVCDHTYNWHTRRQGQCEVVPLGAGRCDCTGFVPGERPEPVDPQRILGAEQPQRSRPARYLDALLHRGPGYDLTPDQPAAETAHQPRRGDQFEAWLKQQRDDHRDADRGQWTVLDDLLDRYRLYADTGTPLGEHVCEARVVGDCECLEHPAAGARQDGAQP